MSTFFSFNHPNLPTVTFSQEQVNENSSSFNTAGEVSHVGSDDFIEAVTDILFDAFNDEQVTYLEIHGSNQMIMDHLTSMQGTPITVTR